MKLTLRTAVIAMMALLLTGCFKMDTKFEFFENEEVSGEIIMGMDKEFMKEMEEFSASFGDDDSSTDENMWDDFDEIDEEGITVSEWSDDTYEGRKLAFEPRSIEDFNSDDSDLDEVGGLFDATYEGDTITVNVDLGQTTDMDDFGGLPGMEIDMPEVTYTFTFPGKVSEASGGGVIDGNTVTYSFTTEEDFENAPEQVTIVASSKSSNPIANLLGDSSSGIGVLGWIIGGIVALVVLVGGGLLIARSRKSSAPAASPMDSSDTH